MGGLGPGIGGLEILVIGLVALMVVGPKDLPVLMRKVGKFMARARAMANEFRSSFDEMARQSELDELRKEVEALRTSQMVPLGAEAEAAFRDIRNDLNKPLLDTPAQPGLTGPDEWPESTPVMEPLEATASEAPPRARKPKATPKPTAMGAARDPAAAKPASARTAARKSKPIRAKKVDL